MIIDVVTAFPTMVTGPLEKSIVGRAMKDKLVEIRIHDLRYWTKDKHRTIDDTPYGGGAGMIYKIEPLHDCLTDITGNGDDEVKIILTSPRGVRFNQVKAVKLSLLAHIVIVCGHYKGVDERIKKFFPIEEISIGDFVLSGGEIPALLMIDAVVRLIPGVLGDVESAFSDSFSDGLLDCDYYTRPECFREVRVPEVLLSGNHDKIDTWRHRRREEITRKNRPDLYKKYLKENKNKK